MRPFRLVLVLSAALPLAPAACGGQPVQRVPRDATTVKVYPPGEPLPPVAEQLSLPPQQPLSPFVLTAAEARNPHRFIPVAPRIAPAALVEWASRYPDAAESLRGWARRHPATAKRLFLDDAQDPERIEALTGWAISNPSDGLESFLSLHGGWDFVNPFLRGRARAGMDGYLEWCRRSPRAAAELVHHAHGLAWAGEHL